MTNDPIPRLAGFDQVRAGRHAECDGGGVLAATLPGASVDHGDPVWCLAGNLFVESE